MKDLHKFAMDELHGILTVYEINRERKSIKERSRFQILKEDEEKRTKIKRLF
jgi:hypothetical protein